jgi:gamma-glutamyltranspeptidase
MHASSRQAGPVGSGGASPWALASPHALSTRAGGEAFRKGGNALDAALAAAASLTVTLPDSCALGGDLIALVHQPSGEVIAVNGSGPAARAVDVDRLRLEHGHTMPPFGAPTVTVPGLLAGWDLLWSLGARRPWAGVFESAIGQAREGVPAARSTASALARESRRLGADPGMKHVFFPAGKPLAHQEGLHQPQLAATLEAIATDGVRAFYAGPIGASWLETAAAFGSSLGADDLCSYQAELTEPLRARLGGEEVLTAPPNSQGALLLMSLRMLEERDPLLDPLSSDAAKLAEVFQAANGARARYLADPRFSDVPVDDIVAASAATTGAGNGREAPAGGDTVAVVTADGEGRVVSLVQSLFDSFGVGILDQRTGIIAHNRGRLFSLDPASPNVLAAGKRPAHTLTPAMGRADQGLRWALGTMGGLAQPQVLTHILLHLRRGMALRDALTAPRWTVGGLAAGRGRPPVQAEGRVSSPALHALAAQGWPIVRLQDFALDAGVAQAIVRNSSGAYSVASDPRTAGLALASE